MPKAWSDVAGSDAFKAMPATERSAARDQYFDQVVRPQISSPGDVETARTQFMEASAPDVAEAPKRKSFTLGVTEGAGRVLGRALGGGAPAQPYEFLPPPGTFIDRARKSLVSSEAKKGVVPSGAGVFTGEALSTLPAALGAGPALGGGIVADLTSDKTSPGGTLTDIGLGAAGGKVLDLGIGALGRGVKAITKKIPDSVKQRAADYVRDVMAKAKKTIPDLETAGAESRGKPLMGGEALGRPGKTALTVLGRREGATPDKLEEALTSRKEAAPERILGDFADQFGITPDAAKGDIESIVKTGKKEAAPLYRRANEGGSIAPLEKQITENWANLGRLERDAQNRVEDANRDILLARAQAARAGNNVYGASGASEAEKAANDKLQSALADLKGIEEDKATLEGFMRQAQDDATSGKKGGIWNTRIARILSDPITRTGMARGLEEERLEATATYGKFDPYEWGVKGYDQNGEPIIGRVPNMKLLNATKKGLDSVINDAKDQYGRIQWSNRLYQIDAIRRNLVKELREANPDYGIALDRSGDYLSVSQAFNQGQKMILNGNVTEKQFADFVEGMTEGELQAAKGGIANQLFNKAQNGQLRPQALLVPRTKAKLNRIFGEEKATEFITRLSIEQEMATSGARMKPGTGSVTSEVLKGAEDQDAAARKAVGNVLSVTQHLRAGHPLAAATRAAMSVWDLIAESRERAMPVDVRDEVGRILMMPPGELAKELRATPLADHPEAIKQIVDVMERARKASGTLGGTAASGITNSVTQPQQ